MRNVSGVIAVVCLLCPTTGWSQSQPDTIRPGQIVTAQWLNLLRTLSVNAVSKNNGESENQTLRTPQLVGAAMDGITMNASALPILSNGATVGTVDATGNTDWAGWLSSAYVVVPDRFVLSDDNGDDALAVQRAADFVCSNTRLAAGRGSALVQFQARTYNFRTSVSPRCAVHFAGVSNYQAIAWYNLPTADNSADSGIKDLPPYVGSWIARQTPSRPEFSFNYQMARGTEIDHLGFYETYQSLPNTTDTAWAPVDGAYTIDSSNLNGRISIHDIELRGVKYGIKLDGGVRDTIVEHIYAQCFNNCLYISHNPDTVYVNDLQVKTPWSTDYRVMGYQQQHLDAVVLGRSDNPQFGNIFVYGARAAFHIFQDAVAYTPPTGGTIGSGTTHKLQINDLDADFTKWAVLIDNTPTSAVTVNIGILNHHGGDLSVSGTTGAIPNARAIEIQQQAYIAIGQLHDQTVDKDTIQIDTSSPLASCPIVQIGALYEDMAAWNNPGGTVAEANTTACDSAGISHPSVYVGMPVLRVGVTTQERPYTNGAVNLFVPSQSQLH